ncbi:hypothetical protein ACWEFJ_37665 [Actinosynnema sp. NPDC004786]
MASVTVRHPQLSRAGAVPYQWLETMGCIWREPVALRPGERSWSLAALLHVDRASRPLVLEYLGRTDPRCGSPRCCAPCSGRCCTCSTPTASRSTRTARTSS